MQDNNANGLFEQNKPYEGDPSRFPFGAEKGDQRGLKCTVLSTFAVLALLCLFATIFSTAAYAARAQCSDGKDNDADGKVDYPDDPGCSSKRDPSENTDYVAPPPPSTASVALGVFAGQDGGDGGAWESSTMTAVHDFESLTGSTGTAKPKLVHMFYPWYANSGCMQFPPGVATAQREGYTPMLTWEFSNYQANSQSAYTYDSILSGAHDACITQMAKGAAATGNPMILRLFHEMNGGWYNWGVNVGTNTPEKHIAAWQHVVDIFRAQGATNVNFAWCPNTRNFADAGPYSSYYPGDGYVDYLCMDGYNWGDANGDPWQSFDTIYRSSYDEIAALPSSDPVIVGEYGSHTTPGDKAQWIKDVEDIVKSGAYPRLKELTYFNQNADGALWTVDTSQASLDAYKAFVADPYYQSAMP